MRQKVLWSDVNVLDSTPSTVFGNETKHSTLPKAHHTVVVFLFRVDWTVGIEGKLTAAKYTYILEEKPFALCKTVENVHELPTWQQS